MTGHIRNPRRSAKFRQTYEIKSKRTITKLYTVEKKPKYPYPIYAQFWIQDFRAPRKHSLIYHNIHQINSGSKMGVTTVIKDYGTEILDAIRQNNLQRLQLILEKQLKSDSKISKLCITDIKHKPSKKFACPLILAARQEDPTILHYMIEKGTDANFVHHTIYSSKRREIVTALHIAVDLGYYENVEVLLSVNADCNIGDHNEETPLHIAVKKADQIMTRMLLSKGADPTIPDRHGNAPLHTATLYGHLQMVKILLKYDADIFQKGQYDAIAPHIAAKEGHIHLIHLFCSRYLGNINIKIPCFLDGREKAPLHLSAENGHLETVKSLLEQYEAEVNLKDSDGNTPLQCCVLNPYDPHRLREKEDFNETAKILLKYRVSVNSKNAFGDSALHLAAMNHFQRIVEMLLEVGANPFIENNQKLKPIDVVPSDDPVTLQVLKMAMMQGPRPLKYPSLESTVDKNSSSGTLSSGHNTISTRNNPVTTDTGVGSSENMLDRSLSIRSSTSTLPSVFAGDEQAHKNSKHPRTDPEKTSKHKQQLKDHGQQTTENEMPVYTDMGNVKSRGKEYSKQPHQKPKHESYDNDSSNQEDTYSFLSQSTTCESGTQTHKKRGRDVGIMARRDRKKSVNKRLQTSFDLDASITYSEMSSQTDLTHTYDLQRSELSIQNLDKHSRQYEGYGYRNKDPKMKNEQSKIKPGYKDETFKNSQNIHKSGITGKPDKRKSGSQRTSDSQYDETDEESEDDYDDETQTAELSQMTPYKSKKATQLKNGPPPGSVRVNTLPGKPGTIELQYSGGPLTIALDTQAFSNNNVIQQDQQGEFFYDQHGNKYPAGMIYALQQAAGLKSGNQAQIPLVTAQTGSDIQHIYKTPERPQKEGTTQSSKIGKPRAPSPKSEQERIYANQDEINAMINGSLDNSEINEVSLESPSAQVISAIHESVHEVTRTPAKETRNVISPTSSHDHSTSSRASKQQDHLRKILGRATPTKVKINRTKVDVEEPKIVEINDPPLAEQEKEESISSSASEEEFEEAMEEPFSPPPPLPQSIPPQPAPKPQPPQKQPRRSLRTPTDDKSQSVKESAENFQTEIVTKAYKKTKKYPEKPLIISRADQSFEDERGDDDDISPDQQWDETPNVSPQHKSFSQKLAWAKALEEGKAPLQLEDDEPEKIKHTKSSKTQSNTTQFFSQEDNLQKVPDIQPRASKSKKIRPPLSPGYKRAVGGIIREEDEEIEDEVLPEYVKTTGQESSSEEEEDSEEDSSSEEEDSEEESEDEDSDEHNTETSSHVVTAGAYSQSSKYSTNSAEKHETSSSSSSKTSGSMTSVVKPVHEIQPVIETETAKVVVDETLTETHEEKLESLKAEAILKQSTRYDRDLSPISGHDRGFSPLGGRQTPDSLYSEGSYSGRVLNMRVTGDTPKAYHRGEKDQKRREWMKAKPVGIESGSEYSDNEFGSISSLNRSLSPGGQERSRKWSEENKPVYIKKKPFEGAAGQTFSHPIETGKPPNGKAKGKLIGQYTKPYKSFGKIETRTDLLEEAMLTSPISPMSPIHTSIPEELETYGNSELQGTRYGSAEILETNTSQTVYVASSPKSKSMSDIRKEIRTSPAKFLETDPENAQPMDTDEAVNIDSANTSIAESSFKKNIKLAEPGPELYETETIEQPVSIGASEEDLLKAAEIQNRKTISTQKATKSVTLRERKMTEDGEIIETVTTTVLATKTELPQVSTAYVVNTDDEAFEDEESSESEENKMDDKPVDTNISSKSKTMESNIGKLQQEDDDDLEQYTTEPDRKKPKRGNNNIIEMKTKISESNFESPNNDIENYHSEPGIKYSKDISHEENNTVITKDSQIVDVSTNQLTKMSPFEEFTESPTKKTKVKKQKKTKKPKKDKLKAKQNLPVEDVPFIDTAGDESQIVQSEITPTNSLVVAASVSEHGEKGIDARNIKNTKTFQTDKYIMNTEEEFNPDIEVGLYDEESEALSRSIQLQNGQENGDTVTNEIVKQASLPLQEMTVNKSIQKTTFETSFGPEDEEVAQINIAAAERKKKKKDKKKKIKKQEELWADQQRIAHENQLQKQHELEKVSQQVDIQPVIEEIIKPQTTGSNIPPEYKTSHNQKQDQYNDTQLQLQSNQLVQNVPLNQQNTIPAAEITFSGGIKVIDETHKGKSNTQDHNEMNEDKIKKKKKKKTEKTLKKKKKGELESTESLNDPNTEKKKKSELELTNKENMKYSDENIINERKTITEANPINQSPLVIKATLNDDKYKTIEDVAQTPTYQHETIIDNSVGADIQEHNQSEGELNKSAASVDDQTGIHATVMGSKLERSDTIKKMDIINMDRIPVKKRVDKTEESESEYTDDEDDDENGTVELQSNEKDIRIQGNSTGGPVHVNRENKMWQQYQKQRQQSLENAATYGVKHDVKETDIDADIYETNIDDEYPQEEPEETNIDDEEEPLPTGDFKREYGMRRSIGKRRKKLKNQDENNLPITKTTHSVTEISETVTNTKHVAKTKQHPKNASSQQYPISHDENNYDNDEQPQSWRDQKEQEEKMKEMLKSYQNYETASLDSDQYATIEYGTEPQAQPHRRQAPALLARDDPRYYSLPTQPTYDQDEQVHRDRQTRNKPRNQKPRHHTEGDAMMAQMWIQQQGRPGDIHNKPRRSDTKGHTSDNETMTERKRRKKKLKFIEDVHSEAELQDLDPFPADSGKTLQEAAMETLTASLQNQPKLTARKPLESAHPERPINYTRGVYRPQPVYWRGSRGTQSMSSSRYDDSQLMTRMWSEQQQHGGGTESEGDVENEYLEPVNIRANRSHGESPSLREYMPRGDHNHPDDNMVYPSGGAFQPYGPKRVQIHDEQRRRREEWEKREMAVRERQRRKKGKAPKTDIGPVDFTKYPATAKIWMEQVDKETVQKSKTMYLSVMPEGMKPPPEIENTVPTMEGANPDDIFLPPQWVIARGRSLRLRKRPLDSQQRESMGSLSGVTSGESDFENADRPDSPGRQMLLFFRVGNNWTDLVWILFEGILNESEIKRMIMDIQLKYPRSLTGQVNNLMHRWWKKKGRAATIEELRRALDIAGMPYIQEEFFDNKRQTLKSNTDTEDDLELSEVSDNDPEVSRLIHEYEVRSLNTSYVEQGQRGGSLGQKMSMSGDNLLHRLQNMEEKGATIDRSRISSHLSASDSVFKRHSDMDFEDSMDEFGSDIDSRRSFVIVQPQLKHKDYNYETQI